MELTLFFVLYRYPVTIAAALLAVLTLLIATRRSIVADAQITEMRTQREASYKPDIILVRSEFYIKTGTETNGTPYLNFNDKTIDSGSDPMLYIHNIGRGVAKYFEYRFIYDVKACFRFLEKYADEKDIDFNLSTDFAQLTLLKRSHLRFYEFIAGQTKTRKDVDFILSTDVNNNSITVPLPHFFVLVNFVKDEIDFKYIQKDKSHTSHYQEFPNLIFECNYHDIGQKILRKSFELKIYTKVFHPLINDSKSFNKITYRYFVEPIELPVIE